ncbi:MAG: hypothetical protein PVG41_05860 [Desulfobacteraceae bacterium]|jgi:hypothetical protein
MSAKKKSLYSEKHRPNSRPDPIIEKEIKKRCQKPVISCARAFEIARHLNVKPIEVGRTADLMNIKVVKCQLGLFGYQPENKIVKAEETSNQALLDAVTGSSENNRLTCEKAWQIADQLNISKLKVSNVSQADGIRIKNCQLGAF